MGAGDDGAGEDGGAGYDSVADVPAARAVVPPHALYLDASVMDFPLDSDGRYVSVHPVDHLAEMLLIPELKTITAAPGQGSPWTDLEIADEATMTARATEIVMARWRDLIARGDITRVTVRSYAKDGGRAYVRVSYVNERDPLKDPANYFRIVEIG